MSCIYYTLGLCLSFVSSFQRMASIFRAFQTILIILILMPFLHSSSRITTSKPLSFSHLSSSFDYQNDIFNKFGMQKQQWQKRPPQPHRLSFLSMSCIYYTLGLCLSFVSSFQRMASIFRAFQTILIILILMPFLHSSSRITTSKPLSFSHLSSSFDYQNDIFNKFGMQKQQWQKRPPQPHR
ncbi:hypothetical protein Gotur_004607 [Gossypium turneri]